MARIILTLLFLSLGSALACNPSDPTGPKEFSIFEVYGLWKLRMESPGCAPALLLNLEFGPFGIAATQDSVRIAGTWYLDQKNPAQREVRGHIYRESGIAFFTLNDFDTKLIEGVFVSNRVFSGAYRELDNCTVRLRGKFIE